MEMLKIQLMNLLPDEAVERLEEQQIEEGVPASESSGFTQVSTEQLFTITSDNLQKARAKCSLTSSQNLVKPTTPLQSTSRADSCAKTSNFEETCITNQNLMTNYLKQILGELSSMNDKLEKMSQTQEMDLRIVQSNLEDSLPLKDLESLDTLEEKLEEKK
ncbi:uncharacterized protein LOC128982554 [Macrosteles quadrilineatus]|nr:uncharacterized protein LOC128982554 [Macrosteles quadrilineatus]